MFKQILSAILLTIFSGNSQQLAADFARNSRPDDEGKSLTVLELFTSEGCSSCPAADRLATRLQQEYTDKLIVLEFHVDYWDRLGWKDPFSKAAFSRRQRNYGDKFNLTSIYTPQAVINGKFEAVGSDEEKLTRLINHAVNKSSINLLEAKVTAVENYTLHIKWEYGGPNNATINFALVQKQAVSNVNAGENRGRKLAHSNIVREFISVNSQSNYKTLKFILPDGLSSSDVAVVGYAEQEEGIVSAIVLENF